MAWDISKFAYSSVSPALTNGTGATGLFFSSDGTKMYICSFTSDTIYQHTLSTAWDVTTASYASKSLSVSAQDAVPFGIFFSTDGTKLYIAGNQHDTIYQYTLTTAWDISTGSYASKSLSVSSEDGYPVDVFFKSDGLKMYVMSQDTGKVYQYTLSTAWDISTASYASKSFSTGSQTSYVMGFWMSPDGTQLFVLDYDDLDIHQYSLSTAWDISTASYDSKTLHASDSNPGGMFFTSAGLECYIVDTVSKKTYLYEPAWDGILLNPEIIISSSTESNTQVGLALPEAVITTSSAMSGVFFGLPLLMPEAVIESSTMAAMQVKIVAPEVEIQIVAGFTGQIGIANPEANVTAAASMESVLPFTTIGSVVRYFLTITGVDDGLEDIDIPMASFQSRRRSGDPTYLNAVIPSVAFINYLTDRPNGTMIVSQGYELDGAVLQRERVVETSIDSVNVYQGGTNNSIVLIGYTTTTYTPKSIQLNGLTYKGTVGGKTTYRLAEPNIFLNPGDEVTVGNDVFTAGVISYSISANSQQIEIEAV